MLCGTVLLPLLQMHSHLTPSNWKVAHPPVSRGMGCKLQLVTDIHLSATYLGKNGSKGLASESLDRQLAGTVLRLQYSLEIDVGTAIHGLGL